METVILKEWKEPARHKPPPPEKVCYICDKCGWTTEVLKYEYPNKCPECGLVFYPEPEF